jgi:hypothetical protein
VKKKDGTELTMVRLDKEAKHSFKVQCLRAGTDVSSTLNLLMRRFVERQNRREPARTG